LSFDELEYYRSLPVVGMSENPFQWWSTRRQALPSLSILAAQFLGISATSWDAHRFSQNAGASIGPLRAEMIGTELEAFVTLHENWEDSFYDLPGLGTFWPSGGSSTTPSSTPGPSYAYQTNPIMAGIGVWSSNTEMK